MGGITEPTTVPTVVVVSQPSFLDSIDWGTKLASNDVKVYFAGNGQVFDGKTSVGWNAYETQQAMLAFQQFANVADLHFTITHDASEADLKLVNKQSAGYLGYFNPPGTKDPGVGVFNHTGKGWDADDPTGGLQQGGYGFITMIHEFGHAMGLAHPHDGGGSSTTWAGVSSPTGDLGKFDLNQGIFSTMTYNDGWQTDPDGKNKANDYGWQGTMMGFDVAVLQQKYGANTTFASGDDSYALAGSNQSGSFFACIWDTGGTDEIAFGGNRNATIDLRAAHLGYAEGAGGYVSYAKGIFGGFTIANGVVIENATGGGGNDTLTGNLSGNDLQGNGGRDVIFGLEGNDHLAGGIGKDVISGGDGADILQGGAGADVFEYADLSESLSARRNFDHIRDFGDADMVDLHLINDLVWIADARFNGVEGEVRWPARGRRP